MKILVLSNGRGEDILAITFLKHFQNLNAQKNLEIDCLPLVGEGLSYSDHGFKVVQHWQILPSQGFLMGWQALLGDLTHGLMGQTFKQIQWLIKQVPNYDLIFSFGDLTSVFFLALTKHPKHYHFNTALTVYLRDFFTIEKFLLRRDCSKIFVRDAATKDSLVLEKVPAIFEGSLMLDDANLIQTQTHLDLPDHLIVLLPSSRVDAEYNSKYLLELLCQTSWSEHFVLALHPAINANAIKQLMAEKGFQIPIYQGALGNLIPKAKAMMGMSGTGCEQMAAMGVPVFLIETKQAASNNKRMHHYVKVLGEACQVLSGRVEEQAIQFKEKIHNSVLLEKMHSAGPGRFGKPGASLRIAQIISRECF